MGTYSLIKIKAPIIKDIIWKEQATETKDMSFVQIPAAT